jgi:hypothetical protein
VKKALKGAKKPKVEFLSVHLPKAVEGRTAKAADLAADGQLSAADKEIDAVLADAKADDGAKSQATDLRGAIEKHVKLLQSQAEALVKEREPELAIRLLDGVAKEFPSTDEGAHAKKRAEEIAADPKMKGELDASKAFERLKNTIRPLKKDKAKPAIEEFAKKYQGTRAAERAQFLLATARTKN